MYTPNTIENIFTCDRRKLLGIALKHIPESMRHLLDPEDIVQQAFLKVFSHRWWEIDSINHAYALAGAVIRHVIIDEIKYHNRSKRRTNTVSLSEVDERRIPVDQHDFIALLEATEDVRKVRNSFSDRDQRIFDMHVDGYIPDEIAHSLRISPSTVYRTVNCIRKKMQEAMEESDQVEPHQ